MKHCSWARLKASDTSYADGQAAKCKANRATKKAAEAKETLPNFLTESLQGSGRQCVKLTFYE